MGCWEKCVLCSCWMKYSVAIKFIWSIVLINSEIPLVFFGLEAIFIGDNGVLKSSTIIVLRSICAYKSSSVYLMKWGMSMFGAYLLTIVIFSGWIDSFINMKWPSLSPLTNYDLKSVLLDMSIAFPVCFQGLFS
jgi:hypothetical protein